MWLSHGCHVICVTLYIKKDQHLKSWDQSGGFQNHTPSVMSLIFPSSQYRAECCLAACWVPLGAGISSFQAFCFYSWLGRDPEF